jgi:hypothetical protein
MRPQLYVRAVAQLWNAEKERPSIHPLHIGAVAQDVGDDRGRLREVRGTRCVRDDAARPYRIDGGPQQPDLQRSQAGQVRRLPTPARLGSTAQRAQTGARRVEQHPVERRLFQVLRAVGHDHSVPAWVVAKCSFDHPGPVRLAVHRKQLRTALRRQTRQQRSLAPWTCAHVEPPLVSAIQRNPGDSEGNELAALVLHAGAALADGGKISWITLGKDRRIR